MFNLIVSLLAVLFFYPPASPPQTACNDQLCRNLQAILDAAVIDFRLYRAVKNPKPGPDVSIEGAPVPCQMSLWANNVPMYICSAKVPDVDSQKWYARTLQALQSLKPGWQFQVSSSAQDHYVDAGPPNCGIPPDNGPRLGECPLHLQTIKQTDGTSKVYLWVNSISSPYLLKAAADSPAKTVLSPASPSAAPSTAAPSPAVGCDDFCQSLKKVFEARVDAFASVRTAKANDAAGNSATGNEVKGDDAPAEATVKLPGAKQCIVKQTVVFKPGSPGTEYVCYWRENSAPAAQEKFHDLIGRLQVLIPSNWSTHQKNELDDPTGAEMTVWYATEPAGKHDIRVYVSAESVGFHVIARN